VETALVLPVLVSLVFGAIEAAHGIHLRQLLGGVAYDVARIATTDGGSEAAARVRGLEMLAGADIKQAVITVSPSPAESAVRGSDVTVTISAPLQPNSIAVGGTWFPMPTVDYRVVMVKQ
jgi:Flp pilus assembly protein TadG